MTEINQQDFTDAQDLILAYFNENYPEIETARGSAIRTLVINSAAAILALINKDIEILKNSQSLLGIEFLTDIDESVVEGIISNWLITRNTGSPSRGIARIVVSSDIEYSVTAGNKFLTEDGVEYQVTTSAIYSSTPDEGEELLLQDAENNRYFFLVPIESTEMGVSSIQANTIMALSPETFISDKIIFIESYTDFSTGNSIETISELLDRARTAITVRDLVTSKSINAVLRDQFSEILQVTTTGMGDREMIRDKAYPTSFHTGGKADVWVRASLTPIREVVTKTILSSPVAVELIAPDTPIYKIEEIQAIIDGELTTLSDDDYTITYSVNNWGNTSYEALLEGPLAARFSSKEKIIITFADQSLFGSTIIIKTIRPALINSIQDFIDLEDNRVSVSDILVKGFVPVFINLDVYYDVKRYSETISEIVLKNDIMSYVNNIPSGESLVVSKIADIFHNYGVKKVHLPLTINGVLVTMSEETFSSTDELIIPNTTIFTQNVVNYFIEEKDITLYRTIV